MKSLLIISALFCLVAVSKQAERTDFDIKEAFYGFMFGAMGYCFSEDVEAKRCGWLCDRLFAEGYELVKSEDVKKDKITYHIFINHQLKRTASTFSGTRGTAQLIDEFLNSSYVSYESTETGAKVLKYMARAFTNDIDTEDGYIDTMKLVGAEYPDYDHFFYGHSLGGALASLALHDISESGVIDINKHSP